VRKIHNDITFIDTFLTPEFCSEHKLFSFNYHEQGGNYVIESREFEKIKQRLLFSLTNFGKPWIYVGGRQLPQPRRTAVAARVQWGRFEGERGPGHPGQRSVHLGPPGPPGNGHR
jgi:spore cortex formation protein SpoVR/YcgB (stage V sporulation)